MINNIKTILPFIDCKKDEHYSIILIRRKKDMTTNKANHQSARVIKSYHIKSKEELVEKEKEIIEICEFFQCRAYIQLLRKQDKKIAFLLMNKLFEQIEQENYNLKHIYSTVSNSAPSKDKVWIIDIDTKDELVVNSIKHKIKELNGSIIVDLPTRQGYNILTNRFRKEYFDSFVKENNYPCEIHKHGTGLLYLPNSLEL